MRTPATFRLRCRGLCATWTLALLAAACEVRPTAGGDAFEGSLATAASLSSTATAAPTATTTAGAESAEPASTPDPAAAEQASASQGAPVGTKGAAAHDERPVWKVADLPEWIGPNLPQSDERGKAERAHVDVENDDWDSERWIARAEPVLRRVLRTLLDARPADSEDPWRELLAEPFEGATPLRPPDLEARLSDAACSVAVAVELADLAAPASDPRESLDASGRALREALGAGADVLPLVTSFESRDGQHFDTRAVLLFDARDPNAAVAQVNATWDLGWKIGADGTPRLRQLRLAAYSEVRAPQALLGEVSDAVFGANASWSSEFLRGVDDFFMRTDRRAGVAYQGMQGLAVGDVDGDGLEDVYVCQQVGLPNRLFVHRPDGTAEERGAQSRVDYLDVSRAALLVDLDNDGDRDLVLTLANQLLVAYNDGHGVFDKQTALTTEGAEQIYSISAADADRDGDLDLYACRYALGGVMHGAPTPYHDANNGATNYYWRNDGVGRFVDATAEAGFDANNRKFSLASIWDDFDLDGAPDLVVINDFGRNNLWHNDGSGHFVDVAAQAGTQDVGAGMGATIADYDLDGDLDLYVTNMFSAPGLRVATQARFLSGASAEDRAHYVKHASGNTLLANRGDGTFEDVTAASGTALGRWAWGSKFTDFNSDGWPDLYVPNGQTTSRSSDFDLEGYFWRRVISQSPLTEATLDGYRLAFDTIQNAMMFGFLNWNGHERNNAYLNLGGGRFVEASHALDADFVEDARCVATLDWDGDGREDLLIKNRTAPRLRLLLNRGLDGHHRVSFELIGRACNRDAVGALVKVSAGGRTYVKRVYAGDGYLTQSSLRLCFGLGDADRIERVDVHWPDGTESVYTGVGVDRSWILDEARSEPQPAPERAAPALRRAALEAARHAQRNERPVDRVVLADRLPMAPFELPRFDGAARSVGDLRGAPLLVHLWSATKPSGVQALERLAAARFDASGLRVVALAVDEGRDLAQARALVSKSSLTADAGYADGRTREALTFVVLEVLGFFDRVPLPTSLLFDSAGQLCALYLGPADEAQIAADAEVLAKTKPRPHATTKLSGGRWHLPARRDLTVLEGILRARGFETQADYYAKLKKQRQQEGAAGEDDDK